MSQTSQFLASHSGSVLFIAMFAEQIGLPLPAAPLLVAAGALAADGVVNPVTALTITLVACLLPDLLWFGVGRRGGNGFLRFICRLPLCDSSSFERTKRLFAKYGMPAITVAKFFPGLSLLMPALAGVFSIGLARFLCFDALGTLFYGAFYLGLGFLFSNQVSGMLEALNGFGTGRLLLVSAFVLIFVGSKYAQRRKTTQPAIAPVSESLTTTSQA